MLYNNNEFIGGNNIANQFSKSYQSAYSTAETSKYNIDEIKDNFTKMPKRI